MWNSGFNHGCFVDDSSNDGGFCGGARVYTYAATALVVVFFLKVPELVWWPPFLNAGFS